MYACGRGRYFGTLLNCVEIWLSVIYDFVDVPLSEKNVLGWLCSLLRHRKKLRYFVENKRQKLKIIHERKHIER